VVIQINPFKGFQMEETIFPAVPVSVGNSGAMDSSIVWEILSNKRAADLRIILEILIKSKILLKNL